MKTIILGPPGTGKTTTLLNLVDEFIQKGVRPRQIGYFSFTRKAANEAAERAAKKFELDKDTDLENIVNNIKPPIFWKDKPPLLAQLKKWSKDKVKYVLNKTYNAEIQIKSSSLIDKNIIMKKLIVDICKLANS